uniref:Putative salivary kunitz domain protein n=1 Tax=Ixodes ricinus TaxID=34613 RepID=A0A147BW63_IXORI
MTCLSMLLTLVLIVQMFSTLHGDQKPNKYIREVKINETCSADKLRVTDYFEVEKYCFVYCGYRYPDSKKPKKFSDGRPCSYPYNIFPNLPVENTGKCINGTCQPPESIVNKMPKTQPLCKFYYTIEHGGEAVAKECLRDCYLNNGTFGRIPLEDGLKCVYKWSWWFTPSVGKVGTCLKGLCIDKQEDCPRKRLTVYPNFNVDESCTLTCRNNMERKLDDGTMCALRKTVSSGYFFFTSGTTTVEEIGRCNQGACVPYDSYTVPPHNSTSECNGTDVFIHQNLTVASHCQVECSDGTTEYRDQDVLCLWRYRRQEQVDVFEIGVCDCGICKPQNNYVVITSRTNPPQKKRPPVKKGPLEWC